MRNAWFALLLALTLAACNLGGGPPVSGDLPVGSYQIADLPAAQEVGGGELRPGVAVYRIPLTSDGAVRISAVSSELELAARLRLVLLDEKGVVQAVSVARNWFAARQELTPLALRGPRSPPTPASASTSGARRGRSSTCGWKTTP
jgi:hypothetical protein